MVRLCTELRLGIRLLFIALIIISSDSGIASESALSKEIRHSVQPYLLPAEHPTKIILDRIFSERRVLLNARNLKKAGFSASKPRKFTKLIIATHPQLPGYFFKLYLDNQRYYKDMPEYEQWILRVQGVTLIREEILKHDWNLLFKVPQKWIYMMPEGGPGCPPDFLEKYTILVEENMNLIKGVENARLWKSDDISYELLSALFLLVKNLGLHDCLKPDNLPFSTDGRVAFIDTQSYGESVDLKRLGNSLSYKNKKFWNELIDHND